VSARVTVDHAAVRRLARKLSQVDRERIAAEVAADAKSNAPRLTGAYAGGIEVQTQGDRVFVVDNDENAVYKEFGTVDTPAHATLTDAARKRGKYSGWKPKST
jgi:hypothetical protein